jgi:6-pyruvoyltetrahydropterin/6-carboxytetrahydropterin synthase
VALPPVKAVAAHSYRLGDHMWTVTKEFGFEAAHSLPHLPAGHKCREMHGHSYRFRVEVTGELDDRGFVLDYAEITAAVKPILEKVDHKNLNAVFKFPTTSEKIAEWLYYEVRKAIPGITRIKLAETPSTTVIFQPKRPDFPPPIGHVED